MKPRVKIIRLRQLLFLVVAFVITLETAFAQENAEKVSGSAQIETRENLDKSMSSKVVAKPETKNIDGDLLNELLQPDSAKKSEQTIKEESCDINRCTSDSSR